MTHRADHIYVSAEELLRNYEVNLNNPAYTVDIVRVLRSITERDEDEDVTIDTLEADIADLARLIAVNTKQIEYLHNLLALLIFELISQGIEIENKRLLNELKLYLKNGR